MDEWVEVLNRMLINCGISEDKLTDINISSQVHSVAENIYYEIEEAKSEKTKIRRDVANLLRKILHEE